VQPFYRSVSTPIRALNSLTTILTSLCIACWMPRNKRKKRLRVRRVWRQARDEAVYGPAIEKLRTRGTRCPYFRFSHRGNAKGGRAASGCGRRGQPLKDTTEGVAGQRKWYTTLARANNDEWVVMNFDLSIGSTLGNVCTSASRIADVVAVVDPAPCVMRSGSPDRRASPAGRTCLRWPVPCCHLRPYPHH
jgi:hypothetical protein